MFIVNGPNNYKERNHILDMSQLCLIYVEIQPRNKEILRHNKDVATHQVSINRIRYTNTDILNRYKCLIELPSIGYHINLMHAGLMIIPVNSTK